MKPIVISGSCPECNSTVLFKKNPYVGQQTYCDKCDSDLEVSQTDPLELEWLVGPGFTASNDQQFTKRRSRTKPSEERKIDPKRARGKKPRKRRVVSDEWENEEMSSRKRRSVGQEWENEE